MDQLIIIIIIIIIIESGANGRGVREGEVMVIEGGNCEKDL